VARGFQCLSAHISGLLFGSCVGFSRLGGRKSVWARIAVGSLVALAIVPLFWSPWSGPRAAYRGFAAHQRGDYRAAIDDYHRALRLGFDRTWLLQNLALAYSSVGDSIRYTSTLSELRRFDKAAAEDVERRLAATPSR
jgi:tetratricopeptide (TPR) repeat protein